MQSFSINNQETPTKQGYYLSGLYLTFAIAIICFVLFIYFASTGFGRASSMTIYIGAAAATGFGLWVQSNLLRFVGGIWFAVSVIAIFWPLLSSEMISWNLGALLFFLIGIMSLGAAYILLLSTKFRIEFYAARECQPPYKKVLRKGFFILLIIAAAVATAVDIYNLTVTP